MRNNSKIAEMRQAIDLLDDEIIASLNKRFYFAMLIADEKFKSKKLDNLRDDAREKEILSKIDNLAIKEIYGKIFEESLKLQRAKISTLIKEQINATI